MYADSFMTFPGGGGPVYRLLPSTQAVPGPIPMDEAGFTRLLESTRPGTLKSEVYPVRSYPDRKERTRTVAQLLTEWREACREGIKGLHAGRNAAEFFSAGERPLSLLVEFFGGPKGKGTESGGQPAVVVLENITDFLNETLRKYIGAAARAGTGGAAHA